MSVELPARASLEHLKSQAKELLRARRERDAEALERFASHTAVAAEPKLADAQHVVAREYGFATWTALKEHIESRGRTTDPFAALVQAFHENDVSRVDDLLRTHPEIRAGLNRPAPGASFGTTPLLVAVNAGNREMIDVLLRNGADINARSEWWAGSFGVLDTCALGLAPFLIERGATVDAHAAARLGMLERLDELISANPELVHARGGDGQTPLHFASSVVIAKYLLDHGASIDAKDVDHESTPAQYMIRDRQDVAGFLVTRGCKTDILMASALGAYELVRRYLDDDPSSIRTRVSKEYFPMEDVRAGGSIYIWTLGGDKTPHVVARDFGHDDVYRLLMERSTEEQQLAQACAVGDEQLFNALLARRPDLAKTLSRGEQRKLVDAAEQNNAAAVRLMLAAGWPVGARGNLNATALHFASWMGNTEIVRELLKRGAPVDVRGDEYDMTPLGWAIHGSKNSWRQKDGDFPGVVGLLLDAGAPAPKLTPDLDASEAVRTLLRKRR
ncbi:MAG: ankyrin repeat domain-containing protein [bacterium]